MNTIYCINKKVKKEVGIILEILYESCWRNTGNITIASIPTVTIDIQPLHPVLYEILRYMQAETMNS
jgi:hypothetical protein